LNQNNETQAQGDRLAKLASHALFDADHNLGASPLAKNKPVRGIAFDAKGKSELPGIVYAPTALGKFRSLLADLDAYIDVYTQNQHKATVHVDKEAIKHAIEVLKHFRPYLDKAFELGRDSERITPHLKPCPDCPKGESLPLEKNKQRCDKHVAERRKIKNRLAKRRQREKEKNQNVSKVSKVPKVEYNE